MSVTNQLPNGDFSQGLTGWDNWPAFGALDYATYRTAAPSARSDPQIVGANRAIWTNTRLLCSPGQHAVAKVWIKSSGSGWGGGRIGIRFFDSLGADTGGGAVSFAPWGSDWTLATYEEDVPADAVECLVWMQVMMAENPGTVWFDDAELCLLQAGQTGTLSITATSDGVAVAASVVVSTGQTGTTPTSFTLALGTYTVAATYAGQTLTLPATITAGLVTSLNFAFATGNLEVHAYADGTEIAASVTADGKSGTTPVTFAFAAGVYNVTAIYQGQILPAQSVTVNAGETATINLHFTSPTPTEEWHTRVWTAVHTSPQAKGLKWTWPLVEAYDKLARKIYTQRVHSKSGA